MKIEARYPSVEPEMGSASPAVATSLLGLVPSVLCARGVKLKAAISKQTKISKADYTA